MANKWMKMRLYLDRKGYLRYKSNRKLVHRDMAYKYIYQKNKEDYTLPFSKYVVHHKDGNKKNYHSSNLEIMTPAEHRKEHHIFNLSRIIDFIKLFFK